MAKILESPLTWFEVLERAIRDGDLDRETIARRELHRLGVVVFVDFRSPLLRRKTDSAAAANEGDVA